MSGDRWFFGLLFLLCGAIAALTLSIGSVEPTQYGLARNLISGVISDKVVRGGIHLIGPFTGFLEFPATQETIELSSQSRDGQPVQTRTGADPNDPDSGGQPISISCSYQYQIDPNRLKTVYLAFGGYFGAHDRWLLLSSNSVSNTAQKFTPQDFWNNRQAVTHTMFEAVNRTLFEQGYITITRFQILNVQFNGKFEDAITSVQVAEQQRVVNEYSQQVAQVLQSIEVLRAENLADVANISAVAHKTGKTMIADANRDAFNMKQRMKAKKYRELKDQFNFTQRDLIQYFKIKTLQSKLGTGKISVGLPNVIQKPPGSATRHPHARHLLEV